MNPPIETIDQAWAAWVELAHQEPQAWLLYATSGSVMNWVTIEFFDRRPIERGEGTWKISGTLIGAVDGAVDHYHRVLESRHHPTGR